MAAEGSAAPDPPKQATTYLLYWRKPEEWGQLIYDWVRYCELERERSAGALRAHSRGQRSARLCVLPCPEMK